MESKKFWDLYDTYTEREIELNKEKQEISNKKNELIRDFLKTQVIDNFSIEELIKIEKGLSVTEFDSSLHKEIKESIEKKKPLRFKIIETFEFLSVERKKSLDTALEQFENSAIMFKSMAWMRARINGEKLDLVLEKLCEAGYVQKIPYLKCSCCRGESKRLNDKDIEKLRGKQELVAKIKNAGSEDSGISEEELDKIIEKFESNQESIKGIYQELDGRLMMCCERCGEDHYYDNLEDLLNKSKSDFKVVSSSEIEDINNRY